MPSKQYVAPHMAQRADKIRKIWIGEHDRQKSQSIQSIIPRLVTFTIGYWIGTQGHSWGYWAISIASYFPIFYLLKYLSNLWKINLLK